MKSWYVCENGVAGSLGASSETTCFNCSNGVVQVL